MSRYGQSGQMQMNFSISTAVKWIVILTVGIWLFGQIALENYAGVPFNRFFALYPAKVLYDFAVWQPLTYIFLHTFQVSHIFFNMLALWMFGRVLENLWGGKKFLIFYMICGLGAAAVHLAVQYYTGGISLAVGASGAVYGLLVAFAFLFPNTPLYLMFIPIPIKAKWAITGILILDLVFGFSSANTGVAHAAHIGGAITGFLLVWYWHRKGRNFL